MDRLSMLGVNPTVASTGGPTRFLDEDFQRYLDRSTEGLARAGLPQQGAQMLPGAGVVKGNRQMLQAGNDIRAGNYGSAAGNTALATMNTALGLFPQAAPVADTAVSKLYDLMARYGVRR
jgi:hypothetical protein